MADDRYVPALRFAALTRVYDPVVRVGTREGHFKRLLVEQASPRPGQRILDLGCGTGTLAIMVKHHQPEAEVVGLDGDPEILERVRAKAASAGSNCASTAASQPTYPTRMPRSTSSSRRSCFTI